MFSSFRLLICPIVHGSTNSTHLQMPTIKQSNSDQSSAQSSCLLSLCVLIDMSVRTCCDWLQGELLSPCRCAGSVRHAHQHCLLKWISEKGSWSCELCNYRFNILPIHIKPPQQVNTHTGIYDILVRTSC